METIRITICVENDVEMILKELQSRFVKINSKHSSFSKIVSMVLISGLLNSKKIDPYHAKIIKSYLNGVKFDVGNIDLDEFVEKISSPKSRKIVMFS